MTPWSQQVGQILTSYRDKWDLTNEEIADCLAVSRWTVSRWMSGQYLPSLTHLYALGVMLELDLRQLLPRMWIARQ